MHKDKEINNVLVEMQMFIITKASRFKHRYRIFVELDDIAQYLRKSIFLLLRDTYRASIGNPEYFAKAACSNFLKRFLQEYYYKRNRIYHGITIYVEGTDAGAYDYESPPFFIADHAVAHPLDDIIGTALDAYIYNTLTPIEQDIFEYITDDAKQFTQREIADALSISQPLVSHKIRNIRKKTTRLLKIIASE